MVFSISDNDDIYVDNGLYIFGYGSLIWKPSFKFDHKKVGYIKGWKRRFWQGSTDHRGFPGSPGRVVTLVRSNSHCEHESEKYYKTEQIDRTWGIAYFVPPETVKETLKYLDHREKGGYSRHKVSVWNINNGKEECVVKESLLYIATEDNEEFLGPASMSDIANQIHKSVGPSGANIEYLLNLDIALTKLSIIDQHIKDLTKLVNELKKNSTY